MLTVVKPGTRVLIGSPDDEFPAVVTAVAIYSGCRISYKVAWWDGRDRTSKWLEADEIRQAKEHVTIGFTNGPS